MQQNRTAEELVQTGLFTVTEQTAAHPAQSDEELRLPAEFYSYFQIDKIAA